MPEKSDLDVDKMLVIPTKSVTNDTEIFLEGLGLHFSENQQAFEEAIEKDSCVAREEARQDTKKAFMYAAALYQNKWRAPFSKMLTHADRVGPYHEANLSCMYFQLRAVGKLVYHDEPKHLPSPSTLYPFRSRVEKFAGARQPATFSVERMPCVEIGGKISIKHSGARGADNEFSDPNKGKLTTGRGTIIKNGKKDDFDPQKPTCRYASVHGNNSRYYPHPWEKEFVFTANSVPEWGDYGNTYVSYEMTWKDKSKQVVNFNLYPPSACKES
ncbi:hypothetical protein CXG81DRAFT_18166 [Caulochytrium protostelioides]|nr:hypothetical protein CXG81DRAFT_18166 [Caulochytrium protostelioides]|eukprot:RKP02125.1 hypothetical protein CXG81DRAFT_18166 [Caulochytrium protostelioides]